MLCRYAMREGQFFFLEESSQLAVFERIGEHRRSNNNLIREVVFVEKKERR